MADFGSGGRYGMVLLQVEPDYTPRSLTVSIHEPDGWSRAEIMLDPTGRRLPGQFSGAFFAVRFTRTPDLPLTMNVYADNILRWRRVIHTPFWPGTPGSPEAIPRSGRNAPGITDYVARADDGLPVPTPRELRIVLVDARGRQVGETRYALPGVEPGGHLATALASVEAAYRGHLCHQSVAPPD
jgi:hypothetical protein